MAYHNQHGGAPHPNGYGNGYAYGGANANGYGGAYGHGHAGGYVNESVNWNGHGNGDGGGTAQTAKQGYHNKYQQPIGGNSMRPNPYAPQFVLRGQGSQKPQPQVYNGMNQDPHATQYFFREKGKQKLQTQIHYGSANITDHPGFAAAVAAPPTYDADDDDDYEARCQAYADAECMTSDDFRRVDAALLQQKLARGTRQANAQAQPAQIPIPLDLQNAVGKIITGKSIYTIVGIIEHGGEAQRMSNGIYRVQHKEGEERVAKLLRVNHPQRQERARAERNVLQMLGVAHSNHVNFLFDAHWANGSDNCILILQYCNGNNVEHWIKRKQSMGQMFEEGFLWHAIHHLCSALALCHHGIVDPLKKHLQPKIWNAVCHLDIKPANIFFNMKRGVGLEDDDFPTLVLGDFGCAVTAEDIAQGRFPRVGQPFGTEAWYPPEGLIGATGKFAGRYGKSTDIWQLGAVIACMARLLVIPNRAELSSTQPCGPSYSVELNKLVHHMLHDDIEKRPTAIDVVEKMQAWARIKEDPQKTVSRERAGL